MTALDVNATLDKEGFLVDFRSWSDDLAPMLAVKEGIELTEKHWEIIYLVRRYYQEYQISPPTRVLTKVIKRELGEDKAKSIYLMKLFTGKPTKIIAKVSGLPKPNNCD